MPMKSNALTGRDLLAALAVVFIWGINFVITKLALQDFTPFQLGAIRFTIAGTDDPRLNATSTSRFIAP